MGFFSQQDLSSAGRLWSDCRITDPARFCLVLLPVRLSNPLKVSFPLKFCKVFHRDVVRLSFIDICVHSASVSFCRGCNWQLRRCLTFPSIKAVFTDAYDCQTSAEIFHPNACFTLGTHNNILPGQLLAGELEKIIMEPRCHSYA